MKKDPKIRTESLLELSIRNKAKKIAKHVTGEPNLSEGLRIAVKEYNLKGE